MDHSKFILVRCIPPLGCFQGENQVIVLVIVIVVLECVPEAEGLRESYLFKCVWNERIELLAENNFAVVYRVTENFNKRRFENLKYRKVRKL